MPKLRFRPLIPFRFPRSPLWLALTLAAAATAPPVTQAQLNLGQYEDEAPLRTWNIFGHTTAAQAALGGTRLAHALDLSASQSNPALLGRLPRISFALSGSFQHAQLFRYGPVNTGVLYSSANSSLNTTVLDFGGVAVNYKGWGLAFTVAVNEIYDRPAADAAVDFQDRIQYSFVFVQEGFLRTYNLGISRRITPRLFVGLGFNSESGTYARDTVEISSPSRLTIEDAKSLDFRSRFLNGGLTWDISDRLILAAAFRTPYSRRADGASQVRNQTLPAVDIRIEVEAESRFRQPLVLGLGANYRLVDRLRLTADASFFNWAAYEADYFGVERDRSFKNILVLGAGAEFSPGFHVFGEDFLLPLRLGLASDPQPVDGVDTSYTYATGGFGLHHRLFHLDAGGMLGRESGSGADLKVFRAVVTLGFRL
jgi:hypothetical protein